MGDIMDFRSTRKLTPECYPYVCGMRNVVTTIEREVALSQARVTERQIVLISVFLYVVFVVL